MNRIASILRSTFFPFLAIRLSAVGLLGCTNVDAAHDFGMVDRARDSAGATTAMGADAIKPLASVLAAPAERGTRQSCREVTGEKSTGR